MTIEEIKSSMDIYELLKLLPHRYPFMLVDRITEHVPGKFVRGYKNVTMNEPFFQGHFPENPVMPGVLMIEALAQVSVGAVMTLPQYNGKLALFAGIDNARFKRQVIPGDRLDLYSEITKIKGPICKTKCTASVDGEIAVIAEIMCAMQ
ncbi:MAG: 3-hydroxyacyl-ACP dehydratase FabZ [Candidatus Gastranaerophilales bacterium]|nr:3-hydroxyacyl-ACP dehydratase FabZ [Candidatus Gastranaerophilales bacterium]